MQKFKFKDLIASEVKPEKLIREGNYRVYFRTGRGKLRDYEINIKKANWKEEESYFVICKDQEKVGTTREELEQILEHIPYRITVKSLGGKYLYVNQKVLEEFRCHQEDLVGKTDQEIFGEKQGRKIDQADRCTMENGWGRKVEEIEINWRGKKKCIGVDKFPFYDLEGNQVGIIKLLICYQMQSSIRQQMNQ